MKNYKALQNYLAKSGKEGIGLSFETLTEILGVEIDYAAALRLQKEFRCDYIAESISEAEKRVLFRKKSINREEDGISAATSASMLWW